MLPAPIIPIFMSIYCIPRFTEESEDNEGISDCGNRIPKNGEMFTEENEGNEGVFSGLFRLRSLRPSLPSVLILF
jgi:hypothetical protein